MNIKTILYLVIVPLVIWALDGINIQNVFKKNRKYQATFLYVIISLGLSYLIVNFFYDFFLNSKFI